MRVTVSHDKSKQQVREAVDRSLERLASSVASGPLLITDTRKSWSGDTMNFTLTAQIGFLRAPFQGWILVGVTSVAIDLDLGLLASLIAPDRAAAALTRSVKGLLT